MSQLPLILYAFFALLPSDIQIGGAQDAVRSYEQELKNARNQHDERAEARALLGLALVYGPSGQLQKAVDLLEQSRDLFHKVGDLAGEGRALHNLGKAYSVLGQPAKSIVQFQKALPLRHAAGDTRGEATTLSSLSSTYQQAGRPRDALDCSRKALQLVQSLGDKLIEGQALNVMALAFRDMGESEEAIRCLREALGVVKLAHSQDLEADTLHNLGIVHYFRGDAPVAIKYYEKALPIFHSVGDSEGEGGTLCDKGTVQLDLGQPQEALESYRKALALIRATGNRTFEATTMAGIGQVYGHLGRPLDALRYLEDARAKFRAADSIVGEAGMLNDIGGIYYRLGRLDTARTIYEQVDELYNRVENVQGRTGVLDNLQLIDRSMGRTVQARRRLAQALSAFRRLHAQGDEANVLIHLGGLEDECGHKKEAYKAFEDARSLANAVHHPTTEASALLNLGDMERDLGHAAASQSRYAQSLALYEGTGHRNGAAECLTAMGELEASQGRTDSALRDLQRAFVLVESMRGTLGGASQIKQDFLRSALVTYDTYIEVLLKRHRYSAAFTIAQHTKARALLDLMLGSRVSISQQMTTEEQQEEAALRLKADRLNAAMVAEGVRNESGSKARFNRCRLELSQTERELQILTNRLYARHPELAGKRAVHPASPADVGRFLPRDTALLEFKVLRTTIRRRPGSERVVMFAITRAPGSAVTSNRHRVNSYNIAATIGDLSITVEQFRRACADPNGNYRILGSRLYRLLIKPADRELRGKKRLIICPDGPLWDLPFAALRIRQDGRARHLIEKFEIAYEYSATGALAVSSARDVRRPLALSPATPPSVLVVANPDFGDRRRFGDDAAIPGQRPIDTPSRPIDTPSRPVASPSRTALETTRVIATPAVLVPGGSKVLALPGTQREADRLKALFPRATTLTGMDAQESTAKSEAGKYRYLHFATHGFFNDASPMLSSIMLAQPRPRVSSSGGAQEDGFLTAREIFDLKLNAEMVVLSACNTARGEKRSGEGVIGLTWALFAAGCPTQVVSQWSVDDASTAALMERFYSGIAKGRPKGASLRSAALSLLNQARKSKIENRKYAHPYYWAPFILMGDWR